MKNNERLFLQIFSFDFIQERSAPMVDSTLAFLVLRSELTIRILFYDHHPHCYCHRRLNKKLALFYRISYL